MNKRIVLKLFLLTTALCMLILATIFIGQTLFFKQYYANQKVENVKTSIKSLKKEYLKNDGNLQAVQKLEQSFSRENNASITLLDGNGNLKNAHDFYMNLKVNYSEDKKFLNKTIRIPLYNLIDIEDISNSVLKNSLGVHAFISGVEKNGIIVPYDLSLSNGFFTWRNKQINKKLETLNKQMESLPPSKITGEYNSDVSVNIINGTVEKLQLPEKDASSNIIYTNHLFMERIRAFQADLVFNTKDNNQNNSLQVIDYEQNDINYKVLIEPVKEKSGEITYIFVMMSLQPVDEAVQMVKSYYMYIIIFVLILILLASFYYSKGIARPLLRINKTTKKMANLDFTEKIPITSKDEIGDLSHNINTLSSTLYSYINQLHQDIEKEKQLEKTRKEFIAGVSHELKTPLSIMKSCISILKDGIASQKKDYYFEAMANEVDKMDMLIVDMLELAKFESGTYKMKMDVFYIDQMIEHICNQLFLEITNRQLYVHKHLSRVKVMANQHRIEQVITNFLTNAIHYTPQNEDIIISTIEENERVKICIENKGVHIPKEQLDKIWDRFYRGDKSRQRSNGGTGLGLAITKNILELHNVQYGVSNTGDGVLFFFYLNKNV
ncbi:two-component sensor histidine kinase [Priestia endophytica]|uniref:HAMP domain-containing sensor histidine kinase n=1 Tax=Priestia endophytica TaxID=135735 RepID=UPI000DCA7B23|nr:HAMP domain-containing sensor histidine kinase [Priestia endophytica]RAS91769.1 two-component sensor histidine kinase [Priestia endophytica]